ncbi:hypothetical protein BDB00DRAFT_785494 [Zychaea mexicana]|uniref:uncharacterized protein n=1 Tax=Zychaea mexicana TaxID=64656 RepID=UPI0022FF162F|nr:uncharacterized protein BDB00DRAFT_785494 [Zychaea mexicana]KAI9496402.1 hypothetical protein BDB00DRAFT_785494 [Zychaea mexicana]
MLLHYHDVVIQQQDYETLEEKQWLNDTILAFHQEYLERSVIPETAKILLLRPGMVELIAHIQDATYLSSALPPNINQYHAVFIPVNDSRPHVGYSGSHWSLLVFLRRAHAFYYYDSMGETNVADARMTARKMTSVLGFDRKPPKLVHMNTPRQANGADCGDNLVQRMISPSSSGVPPPEKVMHIEKSDIRGVKHVRKELRRLIQQLRFLNSKR